MQTLQPSPHNARELARSLEDYVRNRGKKLETWTAVYDILFTGVEHGEISLEHLVALGMTSTESPIGDDGPAATLQTWCKSIARLEGVA